jgi:hypothetical protein
MARYQVENAVDYLADIPQDRRSPSQRPELHKKDLRIRTGLTKAESALVTQIRTEKIGFADFLTARKVPGYSPECTYGFHRQTAKHVILFCPDRIDRKTIAQAAGITHYHKWMTTPQIIRKIARWLIRQDILP